MTQSYQDEFEALNEMIKDLSNHSTESTLRWANQNLKQITAIGGQNFVFNIHQAKFRQMLHKAVDIHFDMNYKRLCANQNVDMEGDPVIGGPIMSQTSIPF